jgi:Ni,Fe-hydrogenase I large subunit
MDPAGRLTILARWDGETVTGLNLSSTRPQAARLFAGRTVSDTLAMLPALFTVCGRAHDVAAHAAFEAARSGEPDPERQRARENSVAAEAAQEHLWRLLLDWPQLFSLEPSHELFAIWYRRLGRLPGATECTELGQELLRMIEERLLGVKTETWEGLGAVSEMAGLLKEGATPWWSLCKAVVSANLVSRSLLPAQAVLPYVSAGHLAQELGGVINSDAAVPPRWQNLAVETGSLARHVGHPLIADMLQSGCAIAARLLARMIALVECAHRLCGRTNGQPWVDAAPMAPGIGLARVETARGQLLHWMDTSGDRVRRYAIVAPTEWNFHPEGALARETVGQKASSSEALRWRLRALVLALDPCVPCDIEVCHA